jgi:Na+-driven multidrug efflux pump
VLLIPLSPLLIFGYGPIPAMGIAGGGAAVVLTTSLTAVVLGCYILSRHSLVRPRLARLRAALFTDILHVGLVGSVSTLQTTLTVALTTALVGAAAGPDAVAGYGTASRLEYLLIPLRVALLGGGVAFVLTETIGIAAALWPMAWLGLFDSDPAMLATGSTYLRLVGPAYGFFGLGLCLYFASQGAGRLAWPLLAGLLRLVIAVGGGWAAWHATGSLLWVFASLSLALVLYGATLATAIASGVWFRTRPRGEDGGHGRV